MNLRTTFFAGSWLSLVIFGFSFLWRYQSTPGTAAEPPKEWPPGSKLEVSAEVFTLLLFVHPHCPCTRATIDELDRLLARISRFGIDLRSQALFQDTAEFGSALEDSDLYQKASAIPGVVCIKDAEGVEASRFGVATSGQVLLYGPNGRLAFSGGLTLSRGHAGDNPGSDAIFQVVSRDAVVADTDVLGCTLLECPLSECLEGDS